MARVGPDVAQQTRSFPSGGSAAVIRRAGYPDWWGQQRDLPSAQGPLTVLWVAALLPPRLLTEISSVPPDDQLQLDENLPGDELVHEIMVYVGKERRSQPHLTQPSGGRSHV